MKMRAVNPASNTASVITGTEIALSQGEFCMGTPKRGSVLQLVSFNI
jgi:hypothetical protein